MLKPVLAACVLLCVLALPLAAEPSADFLAGVRSINIVMHRVVPKHAHHARPRYRATRFHWWWQRPYAVTAANGWRYWKLP